MGKIVFGEDGETQETQAVDAIVVSNPHKPRTSAYQTEGDKEEPPTNGPSKKPAANKECVKPSETSADPASTASAEKEKVPVLSEKDRKVLRKHNRRMLMAKQESGSSEPTGCGERQDAVLEQTIKEDGKVSKKTKHPTATLPSKDAKARRAALEYLDTFVHKNEEWKFQKIRQIWILRNMYYPSMMDDDSFKHCIKYMANMSDKAKHETLEEANEIIREKSEGQQLLTETIVKRARKIIRKLGSPEE